jgi:hypothetical protein
MICRAIRDVQSLAALTAVLNDKRRVFLPRYPRAGSTRLAEQIAEATLQAAFAFACSASSRRSRCSRIRISGQPRQPDPR